MNTARTSRRPGPPIGLFVLLLGAFGIFAAAWFLLQPKPALTIDDAVQALQDGDLDTAWSIIMLAVAETSSQHPAACKSLKACPMDAPE